MSEIDITANNDMEMRFLYTYYVYDWTEGRMKDKNLI